MARFPGSEADLESAALLKDQVAEALRIAEQAERVLRLHIARCEEIDESDRWPQAHGIIATRLADDIRAAAGLVLRGYFAQAMALGASVYELSYTAGFIGTSNDRAAEWLDWDDFDETPWRRTRMVNEVQTTVYGPDAATGDDGRYKGLCWAKHGNPRFLRALGVAATPEAHVINVDPALGGKTHRLGELALWSMLGPVITYVGCLFRAEALGDLLLVEADALIELWEPFDRRVWPRDG